ncbi:hypothetical protein HMN09_00978900 [Mycena chlorophos]|uniref:Uncharacterized protein n=1 Tax=Mycena chlorophos TaxID=658473 RepID=A0A8H6W1P4_MYCCL|nr:hypothetical protein HMN09_00978900 [Mycena chlorophos]
MSDFDIPLSKPLSKPIFKFPPTTMGLPPREESSTAPLSREQTQTLDSKHVASREDIAAFLSGIRLSEPLFPATVPHLPPQDDRPTIPLSVFYSSPASRQQTQTLDLKPVASREDIAAFLSGIRLSEPLFPATIPNLPPQDDRPTIPLSHEQTQTLEPPFDVVSSPCGWVYGYKLFPPTLSMDDPARVEIEIRIMVKSTLFNNIARYSWERRHWGFVYLAACSASGQICGVESGTDRIPNETILEEMKAEVGIEQELKPEWVRVEQGVVFRNADTVKWIINKWRRPQIPRPPR